ncbi:MAG TPA: hypothetical protein DCQ58_05090, partial [Saprospirales bacterium]|nr:hypothetical protein [Saprospirales bacterium]
MRKITLITMFLSFLLLFASCDETPSLTIGYNPQGTPFNISFNTDGELKVFIGGRILTPIGTFFANESLTETYSFHTTFIEIYDRNSELKHVFQLTKDEQFKMNSKYRTSIHIVEKENSTVVTIDS